MLAGKLPHALLAALLADLPHTDPQLLVGPTVGEDAAVIDFAPAGEQLLVVKVDPITFATDQIGYYAVNVCANDLAVTGATPRFFLPTVLLPAGQSDAGLAQTIFAQIGAACRPLGIVVAGGHSEITPAVSQPVVAGALLGMVHRDRLVRSGGSRPGDLVLLAGIAPVEGVSIIARERRSQLLAAGWSPAEVARAANFLYEPGISVLRAGIAGRGGRPGDGHARPDRRGRGHRAAGTGAGGRRRAGKWTWTRFPCPTWRAGSVRPSSWLRWASLPRARCWRRRRRSTRPSCSSCGAGSAGPGP